METSRYLTMLDTYTHKNKTQTCPGRVDIFRKVIGSLFWPKMFKKLGKNLSNPKPKTRESIRRCILQLLELLFNHIKCVKCIKFIKCINFFKRINFFKCIKFFKLAKFQFYKVYELYQMYQLYQVFKLTKFQV